MGLVMDICLGSAIQIALVVSPLLAVVSWFLGHPMTLVFGNPLDLFAIGATALIVNSVAGDGETTWFEGLLLVGVYLLLALAFLLRRLKRASPAEERSAVRCSQRRHCGIAAQGLWNGSSSRCRGDPQWRSR